MRQDRSLLPLKPAPEILHSSAGRRQAGQGMYSTPMVEASLRNQNYIVLNSNLIQSKAYSFNLVDIPIGNVIN